MSSGKNCTRRNKLRDLTERKVSTDARYRVLIYLV